MVNVPLSNSFLEKRDGRRKRLPGAVPMSADLTWIRKWLERIVLFASAATDRYARLDSRSIATSGQDQARTGRSHATNLRSHFVIGPRRAPEWLRARFFQVVFLANEGELIGKTFTISLNTTNPNTNVKFIFLRTSPLRHGDLVANFQSWLCKSHGTWSHQLFAIDLICPRSDLSQINAQRGHPVAVNVRQELDPGTDGKGILTRRVASLCMFYSPCRQTSFHTAWLHHSPTA